MKTVKVIDNFLEKEDYEKLRDIMSTNLSWYYNDYVTHPPKSSDNINYQFTHYFYRTNTGIDSDFFDYVVPLLNKLDMTVLLRCKANLNPKTHENGQLGDYHSDYNFPFSKTAIFYVNTNNGFTSFEDGTKVDSVANRLVLFDTPLKHVGYSCTDENARTVINVNYIPNGYES